MNIIRLTLLEKPFRENTEEYNENEFRKREQLIPGGNAVKDREVIEVIKFLIDKKSSCINGNIIKADRGETI